MNELDHIRFWTKEINDLSGPVTEATEIFYIRWSSKITFSDLTLDGQSYRMQLKGYGKFDQNGVIISGNPQFPVYDVLLNSTESISSSGSVFHAELGEDLTLFNVTIKNGFGWCVAISQIRNFLFRNSTIDTGNLFTNFRGHRDPGGSVLHVHSSQDGLHLVNVVNAVVDHSNIFSQDSAIAIEANPNWNWFTFPNDSSPNLGSRNIQILNNFIQTNRGFSGIRSAWTDSSVYGTQLATNFVGEGGIDIFYSSDFETTKRVNLINQILVSNNAIVGTRYGVRAGFFLGAGSPSSQTGDPLKRISNIIIRNQDTTANKVGRFDQNYPGIYNIKKGLQGVYNPTGGVGVALRHVDHVEIINNTLSDITGGTGIELVGVTNYQIIDNKISNVTGNNPGDSNFYKWDGGEGIRIWDNFNPLKYFDSKKYIIAHNQIKNVASNGIYITGNTNGTVPIEHNNITGIFQPGPNKNGIYFYHTDINTESLKATIVSSYLYSFGRSPGNLEITTWMGTQNFTLPTYIQKHRDFMKSPQGYEERKQTIVRAYKTVMGRNPSEQELSTSLNLPNPQIFLEITVALTSN